MKEFYLYTYSGNSFFAPYFNGTACCLFKDNNLHILIFNKFFLKDSSNRVKITEGISGIEVGLLTLHFSQLPNYFNCFA